MSNSVTFNIKLIVDGKEKVVEATTSTKDLEQAFSATQAKVGKLSTSLINFNQTMEAMRNTIGAAVAKLGEWSDGMRKIQSDFAKASQLTGLAGDELMEYSAQAKAIADTFDSDLNEVMRSSNTLMNAFGLSADEALKMMKDGFVSGGNANGEYLDTLREYPRYFKEAGLSAEEFIAITANASKQGIFSDKGVDAIKEGNIRIREFQQSAMDALDGLGISSEEVEKRLRDGSMTTFQVMQLVAAKLKEMPASSKEVGAALADIFGGPGEDAAVEYIKSLDTVDLSLANAVNSADEYSKALGEQADAQAKSNEILMAWQSLVASANASTGGLLTVVSSVAQNLGNFGMAAMGATQSITLMHKAILNSSKAMTVWNAVSKFVTGSNAAVGTSAIGAAAGLTTMKMALRGLMVATGVGAVLAALGVAAEVLNDALSDTEEAADDAAKGMGSLSEAEKAGQQEAAQAKVALDNEIKELRKLVTTNGDASDAIKHLNETYGEIFGSHKTAADWYDTLTRKSQIYVKQIGYEAQAKVLATKLAEKQIQLEDNYAKRRDLWKSGGAQSLQNVWNGKSWEKKNVDTDAYTALKDEARGLIPEIQDIQRQLGICYDKSAEAAKQIKATANTGSNAAKVSKMNLSEVEDAITKTTNALKHTTDAKKIKELKAYNKQLEARKKLLEKQTGLDTDKGNKDNKPVADPKTLQQLSTNIEYYSKKLTGADTAEQRQLIANIQKWKEKKQAIELAQKQAERPIEIKTQDDVSKELDYLNALRATKGKGEVGEVDKDIAKVELKGAEIERPTEIKGLQDIDKELNYQRKLRAVANDEAIAGIDAEISRLQTLQNYLENKATIDMPDDAISTYEQLNVKLSYYNELLQKSTTENRPAIQEHINQLNDIKDKWDETLTLLNKPADISTLDTIKDLDDAISYYGNLMQSQSSAEIEQTQRTIDALERKRDALQAIADIPQMQREVGEVSSKKGSRKRKALQGVDFDGRIEELSKMKMGGNLTDSQMKEIDALIEKYKDLKRESALSFDTLQEGWGNIKGIGSAVSSISDALEGNADAWTTITSVVDGALQMYQSISGIVEIINALTGATAGQTAAEGAKTGVTATSTQTTMQDTLATQMNTQAAAENTAVKSGEAIVNATASGAKLGFPANIVAIAAGVAAVVAALSMVGSFSTGGIVGGNSPTGDKLMARVNSGEMILNRRQQQRLLDILSGKSMVSAAAQRVIQSGGNVPSIDGAALAALEPREPSINIHLKSRIRGNDITQSVANTSRIRGASGHRTNIKI